MLALAAEARGASRAELLGATELLIYATTRAINAVLTGTAARTALLTTEGHPEILVFREGGRTEPFNHRRTYPPPYVPRRLTWEVPERVDSEGRVLRALNEDIRKVIDDRQQINAVEADWPPAVGDRLTERTSRAASTTAHRAPARYSVHTLPHELNPTIREYRRASATALDASLKPVMTEHLAGAARSAPSRGRADDARRRGHLERRRDGGRGRRGGADPRDHVRPGDGARRGTPLRHDRRPVGAPRLSPTPAARALT